MKTRFLRSVAAIVLVCTLAFSLTGCDSLDYRKAIDLYNAGKYDAAAQLFYELGDHENSSTLYTRSQYRAAITLAAAGNYAEALPRFIKLGDYEDSAQRVTECNYQIAVAAFEASNYTDAEIQFQAVADYRQSQEYLRRINWQKLYDALAETGDLRAQQDNKTFLIRADESNRLYLAADCQSDMDAGSTFSDQLLILLPRDTTTADYSAASSFSMELNGNRIGSEQTAEGKLDITTCTSETSFVMDTFAKTVTDNLGNNTTSTDPADSLMNETMAENLNSLMDVIPELLSEAGIAVALQDIGFSAI